MSKVLVAYVTEKGSTEEVAKKIVQIMEESGHDVDLMALGTVGSISSYDSVVIGAPVFGMKWQEDAMKFVKLHQKELGQKKVVYFTLAIMAKQGRAMWQNIVHKSLNKPSSLAKPIDKAIFGGVAGDKMPTAMRIFFGIPKDSSKDQRDWPYIEKWAKEVSIKI